MKLTQTLYKKSTYYPCMLQINEQHMIRSHVVAYMTLMMFIRMLYACFMHDTQVCIFSKDNLNKKNVTNEQMMKSDMLNYKARMLKISCHSNILNETC